MPTKPPPLAKLSRPRPHGSHARTRLFAILEEGMRRPVVWITGPPGAGKTTLAATYLETRKRPAVWDQLDSGDGDPASFFYYLRQAVPRPGGRQREPLPLLTPEYRSDLTAFARRWWRELCARLPDLLVVMDNYQEVPTASPLHRMLAAACEEIPEGANLLVLSRSAPPAEFSRLLASDRVAVLEWEDLRLDLEEARGIATARGSLDETELQALYAHSNGWAAGFTLMRERLRRTGQVNRLGEILPRETVFDYFATQIFDEAPPETRETLIRTAVAPRFTVAMAQQLSGNPHAGELLSHLHAQHLFINCRSGSGLTYEYHALFRSFLLAQARTYYTPRGMAQLQAVAAGLLEQQGQLEDAVDLYLAAQTYDAAAALLLRHAESLLTTGRAQTLRDWIGGLPGEILERFPWLNYWSGACALPIHPATARGFFELAWARFGEQGDTLGEIRAAVGIIDSYYLERAEFAPLDPWIDRFFDRIARRPRFTRPADELSAVSSTLIATAYRQPWHPQLPWLAERTRALIEQTDVGPNRSLAAAAFLMNYYDWTGATTHAAELMGRVRPLLTRAEAGPLWRASWELRLSIHHLASGDLDAVAASLRLARTIAREHGFASIEMTALLFETMLHLSAGDVAAAERALDQAVARIDAGRRMDYSLALKFRGWLALVKGDLDAAVQLGERAGEVGAAAGAPNMHSHTLIYLTHFYSELGEYEKAHAALDAARACTTLDRYPVFQFDAQLVCADLLLREGNDDGAATALRSALELGERRGYFGSLFWIPPMMERLCAFALEHGIQTAYVKRLILRRGLRRPTADAKEWPWPLRIFTLGSFALERDGEPVRFVGKVPKKPLELLKVLIAFGGRSVATNKICAALWPDAEADAAENALGITLQRLRKVLGDERTLIQQAGKLTLDPGRCWVDAWELLEVLERAEAHARVSGPVSDLQDAVARILTLNSGVFLAGEPEQAWLLPLRERLKARITRVVLRLGQRLDQAGSTESAIELYRRALDQDNLAEEIYRRLILCHAKLGQRAEAIAVYRRCRDLFSIVLGIRPSDETQRAFRDLYAAEGARYPVAGAEPPAAS